ncbi:MAG: HAMP domain-containing sensor histidine kinase, partial [Desulfococcaceae bacterium]|nr:HAMP domain-containing sensor histidine kinase [Desulfococcaceae bacterium]
EKWLTCRPGSLLGTCREFDIVEETLRDNIRNAIEKGIITYEFDFESRTEEDDVRFVMQGCTSVIYDKSGIARGTVTAFHDVTREREADRIKTEFLSTAAHELRTPLTSILGFSELLLTRQNLTEGEKSEFLTYINRQAANLGNLINDLLDLSRIESGKGFVMQFGPHIMEDLIRDVVSYYKGIFLQHEFITELGEKSIYVDIDRDKICQVLHNLLSNSIKFSPGGGTIRIRAGIAGSNYSVCVRDEGIGMTADQMEKMFDKFYRADAGDSAPEGTGLGMSIVKHIIRAHKGEIQVSSDYGQGATVCFFIPIRKYQ